MGKVFITDEVNDMYTADITSGGQLRVNEGASTHIAIASAASSATVVARTSPCWIKSVIVGSLPGTATTLLLLDTATSGASASTFDVSGANKIAKIRIAANTVTAQTFPGVIPIDVYCTTGLTYALGGCGTDVGNLADITIVYQT
jgi:hypothetical protein